MTIIKTDVDGSKEEYDENRKQSLALVDDKDLEYTKAHQSIAYKILKHNPIDSINYYYRKFIEKNDLLKYEGRLQWWAAYIYVKFVARTLWSFRAEHLSGDLFPEWGAGIIVSNHESHLDPFFLGAACHRRIRYMSKLDNFKTPIVRTIFKNLGAFELDRENPDEGWKKAKEVIEAGEWVGVFAEGTRTEDGTLGEFKTGGVRLAIEMGVPIVPMAVIGSRNALPKGRLVIKPTKVSVRVGKALYYDDYNIDTITYPELRRLTNELRQIVTDLRDGNYEIEGTKKKEELSIGSPKDIIEKKPRSNSFMRVLKKIGKDFIQLWDDSWYAMLKSAEVFGLEDVIGGLIYHLSGNFVHAFSNLISPYKIIDYDKYIPKEGAAIICSNHNSEWDVFMLATTFQQRGEYVHQQAKESLFKIPIVNSWVRSCRAFPLKRGGHDVGSYNHAVERLKLGDRIIIYPEGTTHPGPEILPGHTGAVRAAIEAKVPIILIGITGTEKVYPKHAKMLNFGKGTIFKAGPLFREHEKYFDKPMPSYEELQRLTENMMAQIKELLMYDTPNA